MTFERDGKKTPSRLRINDQYVSLAPGNQNGTANAAQNVKITEFSPCECSASISKITTDTLWLSLKTTRRSSHCINCNKKKLSGAQPDSLLVRSLQNPESKKKNISLSQSFDYDPRKNPKFVSQILVAQFSPKYKLIVILISFQID